jgi:hypothetical protein
VAHFVFQHLPTKNKGFIEKEELDHGPFSDGSWYKENVELTHEWF